MNKFSAEMFINIGSSLEWYGNFAREGQWDRSKKEMGERMGFHVAEDLERIGCEIARDAANRFALDLSIIKSPEEVRTLTANLRDIIHSEMSRQLFLWVPPECARFYEFPEDVKKWDETERAIAGPIAGRFKKASDEIYSARRCYALGQWTPCVFHLMRACEVGIKALYKTLNEPGPRLTDSWGNMLKPMDAQLQKKGNERYGEWAKHPDFFDHATNDVRAIKRAWRDKTMHIEANYDESGARKALDAVTSFFIHLAEKLDQDGNFYERPLVYPKS
jgi:hypothetical protein